MLNPSPPSEARERLGQPRVLALGATALALLVAACASPPLGDPLSSETGIEKVGGSLLTGAQARATLGKPQRYRWTTASGASGYTQVAPNGRIRTYWDSDAVNGRIRFTKTGYCTAYQGVRNDREDCYRIYRVAPAQYRIFREDGTYSGMIELEG